LPESSNYYEILGIALNSTALEIKKSYFASVRKYPPERFPEEFKRIREAYETLSEPESRSEYDTGMKIKGFAQYYEKASYAYDEDRYDEAIGLSEKALEFSPGNKTARNLMGMCFIKIEEYNKAAILYKKLISESPEKPFYYSNLGEVLLAKGAYKQAIKAFETALGLDRSHDYSWAHVGYCYYLQENYEKARQMLEQGIDECGESISIYTELIRIDIAQNDLNKLIKNIGRLEKLAKKDEELKETVAWFFTELAKKLMQHMPDFAAKLLEKAKKLDPDEKGIYSMHKKASKIQKLQEPIARLKNDLAVHIWIKDIAAKAVLGYADEIEERELSICERLLLREPANVLSSIKHLKVEYPEIFKEHKGFFQKILDNPMGSKVNENEILSDMRYLDKLIGKSSGNGPIALDDIYIPPMQRINTASVGRNEPCPCGSGKKYKKCCCT